MSFFRRDKAADLRHQNDKGCLTHISRLTSHIWACDDRQSGIILIQICIIGNELTIHHFFYHRMSAAFDVDHITIIHDRFHIIHALGNFPQGLQTVNDRHDVCTILDTFYFCCNSISDLAEHIVFHGRDLIISPKDNFFQFFQFRSNKTFRIGKGLFADICFGYHFQIGSGNFDIITKNLIVTNLQVFDTCFFSFFFFQFFDPRRTIFLCLHVSIQFIVEAFTDHTAFSDREGRVFHDGTGNQFMDIFQRIQLVIEFLQIRTPASCQNVFHQRQVFDGVFQCRQISGIGILIHHAGHDTLKIVHGAEDVLDFLSQEQIVKQLLYPIQTLIDLVLGQQRLFHPFTQKSRTHGCLGLIHHAQQRTFFVLFTHGFCQLQISAAGNIQQHKIPCCIILQTGNMTQIIFLCFIQIPHQSTGSSCCQQFLFQTEAFQCFYLEMLQ